MTKQLCTAYSNEKNWIGGVGVCNGTKEREPCDCRGDETSCDFYPEVRARAKNPITNANRIRNMTDLEMAKYIELELMKYPWCREDAPVDTITKECLVPHQFCWECALDWLRKEVTEG